MIDRFPIFFDAVLQNEGYFQNNPNDKGNWYKGKLYGTICGITARDYPKEFNYAYDLYQKKEFARLKEYCMQFYRQHHFWSDKLNAINDSSLAFKIFDFGINAGHRTAIKLLQQTLVEHYKSALQINGELDDDTINELNRCYELPPCNSEHIKFIRGESLLYATYIHVLQKWYKTRNSFGIFGEGWLRRLRKILNANDRVYLSIKAKPPFIKSDLIQLNKSEDIK